MLGINQLSIRMGSTFTALFGVTTRFFTELQSSLSQHYTLDLTFAEDETLSIDFATTSTGNEEALLGDNPIAHALLIRTDGKIELVGATTVVFNSVVTDGSLNTFQIVRTGTGVEGFLNGATDGTCTISGDIDFTRIAGQNGNYFNGIIANLTKDLTHDLKLDEDFSTTTVARNIADDALGEDEWSGNFIIANAPAVVSTIVSEESWDIQSSAGTPGNIANGGIRNYSTLIEGQQYIYSANTDEPVNLLYYNQGFILKANSDGGNEILFTAEAGLNRVYVVPRTTNTVRVTNATIRKADGYATAVNITESDLYTQVADGWTGVDIWGSADLVNSNGTVTVVINTSGSSWDVSTTAGAPANNANAGIIFNANSTLSLVEGQTYIWSLKSTNPVNLAIYDSGFALMEFVSDGTEVQFVATATTRLYMCPRDTSVTTITNSVVKRFVEVAP